jgi:hypothetical protein
MFVYPCKECHALFGEMRSAVVDAKAIVEEAGELIHANKPSEHTEGWSQTRDQWQSARQRWLEASRDLQNHLAAHQSSPTSPKSMAYAEHMRPSQSCEN